MIKLQLNPNDKMLAQFAWVAPLGFLAFAWLFSRFGLGDTVFWATLSLGPVVLLSHLVGLRVVPLQVFRALVLLTFPIGLVVLPLVIGLIYYGVFTPMGLLMRLAGRDTMGRKFDRSANSYWRDRGAPRPATSYFKLY
jgi:hypothetical protein